MRLNFRQGIIKYPYLGSNQNFLIKNGSDIGLNAEPNSILLTFAHGLSNYTYTEDKSVNVAWPNVPSNVWLYWELNRVTAQRTFGWTSINPIYGPDEPTTDLFNNLHWFDTTNNKMFHYTGGSFHEVIRLFAAFYDGNVFRPTRPGATAPNNFQIINPTGIFGQEYAGTQVSVFSPAVFSGRILYQDNHNAVRSRNGEFLTTESEFFIQGSRTSLMSLESEVVQAEASTTIPAYTVVKVLTNGKISPASYNDINTTIIGVVPESLLIGDVSQVFVSGIVTNPIWNFSNIGGPLWIDGNGVFTEIDPNTTSTLQFPKSKPPIARIFSSASIMFQQGLGGIGERGRQGNLFSSYSGNWVGSDVYQLGDTVTYEGSLFQSLSSGNINNTPTGVDDNYWRLVISKGADGDDGSGGPTDLSSVVAKAGDSMSGTLIMGGNKITSSYAPVDPIDLTNKLYVDNLVSAVDLSTVVLKTGDVMSGTLTMGTNKIISIYVPVNDEDLTNKLYVDSAVSNIIIPPSYSSVVDISTESHTLVVDDIGKYLRFSFDGAKTVTLQHNSLFTSSVDVEIHGRNSNTGNLTITPGSDVTINAPYSGTLVVPPNGTFTLKKVVNSTTDVWDLFGITV